MPPSLPWWAWAVIAAALAVGEFHAPGAYLIWIAIGAAVTAAFDAAFGLSLYAQIGVFIVVALISCLEGYRVYGRLDARRRQGTPLNERDQAMIGAHGVVSTAFVDGQGKVRIGDTVWLAEGGDYPLGMPVVVTAVRGTTVVVAARRDPAAAGERLRQAE
jgi:membrane protein implicated in regulation of membrane protease activity